MSKIRIGCIADDFTGGSDAASFLKAGGLTTVLCSGIPPKGYVLPGECEALVIALKTRSVEKEIAVRQSLRAFDYLREAGADKIYFKYCSTFDSTPKGNIGPVLDALMDRMGEKETVICPSLPINGRTVKNGVLYVNGIPLSESSMKDHPLNPMWDSRIAVLMKDQGMHQCKLISKKEMSSEEKANTDVKSSLKNISVYYVPDYETDSDAELIAEYFSSLKLFSGGSGLLKALAHRYKSEASINIAKGVYGKALILSGSCSVATRTQIDYFIQNGGKAISLNEEDVLNDTTDYEAIVSEALSSDTPLLVYSFDSPDGLKNRQKENVEELARKIENTISIIARKAVDVGISRIITAGGETSGAVTEALGFAAFWLGENVAPGVPVLIPTDRENFNIVLKSGNFGDEAFFTKAIKLTQRSAD